jgi:hypothetical protein
MSTWWIFIDAPLAENYVRNYGLSLDQALAAVAARQGRRRPSSAQWEQLRPLRPRAGGGATIG